MIEKIFELLKELEGRGIFNEQIIIELCTDGSGKLKDGFDNIIIEYDNIEECKYKLEMLIKITKLT